MKQKIFVTSSNGLLDQYLERVFKEQALFGFHKRAKSGSHYTLFDMTHKDNVRSVLKSGNFDFVIHAAALSNVDECEKNKELAATINVDGVKNIVDEISDRTCFIYISTDYVFDGKKGIGTLYQETDPCRPVCYYGQTKLEAEYYIQKKCSNYLILRTAWIYGIGKNNFVNGLIEKVNSGLQETAVVSDKFGCPTYAHDLAEAIYQITDVRKTETGIYHLANTGMTSYLDWARHILRLMAKEIQLRPISMESLKLAAIRPPNTALSMDKVQKDFALHLRSWQDALKSYVKSELAL